MVVELDLAGHKASPNQQRPKVALVIVHFVIVHFYLRAEAKAKCGELEQGFPAPGWDVNEKDACWLEQSANGLDNWKRVAQMFQDRDQQNSIKSLGRKL